MRRSSARGSRGARGRRSKGAASLSLLLLGLGCGYQLQHGSGLPHGARSVRVAAVDNRTAQAEAGGVFAAALRSELASRGRLAGEGFSGPLLEAELSAIRSAPSAFAAAAAPAFRLEADLKVRLRDSGGAVVYEDTLSSAEDYLAGVDVLGTEANRRSALRRLSAALAQRLVERMEVSARLE
jgi:hypothetical protein